MIKLLNCYKFKKRYRNQRYNNQSGLILKRKFLFES